MRVCYRDRKALVAKLLGFVSQLLTFLALWWMRRGDKH